MISRGSIKYGKISITVSSSGYFCFYWPKEYRYQRPDMFTLEKRFGEKWKSPIEMLFKDYGVAVESHDDHYYKAYGHLLTARRRAMFHLLREFKIVDLERDEELFALFRNGYATETAMFYERHGHKVSYLDRLFEKQKEEIPFLCNSRTSLLAFDMGTGKTITSATASLIYGEQTLVICPLNVKPSWANDLVKEWGVDPLAIREIKKKTGFNAMPHEKFIVVHYEDAKRYYEELKAHPFNNIIVDEAHNIKNRDSAQSQVVTDIIHFQRKRNAKTKVMLLTGTPYKNSVTDLIAYLKIAEHPMGKVIRTFQNNYCQKSNGGRAKLNAANAGELYGRLLNFMPKLKKEDIKELHTLGKTISNHYIDSDAIWETYRQALQEMAVTQSDLEKDQALKRMLKVLALYKVPHCQSFLKEELLPNGKVLVFSMFVEPLEILHGKFKNNSVLITGNTNTQTRLAIREQFINDSKIEILFATLGVAGTGINGLQKCCSQGIFLDLPFTPAEFFQGTDRLDRIGQKEVVSWYLLTCVDTLDEVLSAIIKNKKHEQDAIVDGKSFDPVQGRAFFEVVMKEVAKKAKIHEAVAV